MENSLREINRQIGSSEKPLVVYSLFFSSIFFFTSIIYFALQLNKYEAAESSDMIISFIYSIIFAAALSSLVSIFTFFPFVKLARKNFIEQRHALNMSNEGIAKFNRNGQYEYVNASYALMIGYLTNYLIGKKWDFRMSQKHTSEFKKIIDKIRNTRPSSNQIENIEIKLLRSNNSAIEVMAKILPIFDQEDKYAGFYVFIKDLTEIKKLQQNISNNETILQSILNNSKDGIFIKDNNLKYVKINNALAHLFNKPMNEIIGKTDKEIMEYQLAKQLKESDDHVIKNQSKTNCEEYFQNPNKHLYVTISKSAIKNDKEEIHGICGFATEISKFSNYFNLENNYIFNNLSFKIWQINANGQIISVNKRALKLTNLTYEEILGKKMSDIFDFSVYKKEQEAMLFETGGTQLSIEEILVCKETSEQYTFISDKIIYNHPESKNASLIIFSRIKD